MTRLGTDSAHAPSDSLTLRLVWKALVPRACFPTRIMPVYTDRDRPPPAPLNSRFDVQSGAMWSWKVRKSSVWSPSPKYTASSSPVAPRPTMRQSVRSRA